ncbi:MAG: sel1 repeat family protein [Melioribacteraceae bacterium]|nr:sel1 repeat family protein [Melioribacteraceae bacterium]
MGFPKDTVHAVEMIKLAADKNLTSARFNYAIMLSNNVGVKWNPFEAFKHIKFAAEKGMPVAQYAYAIQFTDNLVVNRNLDEAYKWLKLSESGGYKGASKVIEQLKENGYVPNEKDDDFLFNSSLSGRNFQSEQSLISREWEVDFIDFNSDSLTETEDNGKLEEFLNKESSLIRKTIGIVDTADSTSNRLEGFEIIAEASENGSPEALLLHGRFLEKGVKVNQNLILSAEKYIKALRFGSLKSVERLVALIKADDFFDQLKIEVDKENPIAMYVWAGLTALGFDFKLTNGQAFDLLIKASEMEHIPSIIEAGLCYSSGTLVEKNIVSAEEYWGKAKKLGSREAEVRLAMLAVFNESKKDLKDEIKTLQIANDEGMVLALTALGYCYESGKGVKGDKSEAVKLYRQAAGRGSETSFNALKRMYNDLRPDEEIFEIVQ